MKERPILFSGEMVKAILEGRKTQTRRVIKPQPVQMSGTSFPKFLTHRGSMIYDYKCPYGQVGDRLWVRETWSELKAGDDAGFIIYKADNPKPDLHQFSKWKPSIHMRREYSRINLEITDIRVERLQDIIEEDARSEGVKESVPDGFDTNKPMRDQPYPVYKRSFSRLWESINGLGSWDKNPWVWVVEFRRIP